jgi:hypothetical protein
VLRSGSNPEVVDGPTRAVAVNNSFADSGRIDSAAPHRKTVGGAAKKLEGLLADPAAVRAVPDCLGRGEVRPHWGGMCGMCSAMEQTQRTHAAGCPVKACLACLFELELFLLLVLERLTPPQAFHVAIA